MKSDRIASADVRSEHDVVLVRQRARHIAAMLKFDLQQQTRIATATSEIVRNAYSYGGGGRVEFALASDPQRFVITVHDRGAGIKDIQEVLDGQYESKTGMGLGIIGARRLMDHFEITCSPNQGTRVVMAKFLPATAPLVRPADLSRIAEELTRAAAQDPNRELLDQNRELLRTLEELRKKQEELEHVNEELEDTNRGVVALYAELDQRADYLQRASELKSRFLSNMSHEFRTPLNSILSLTRLLLDRVDGNLTSEQEKQVTYIRRSAEDLTDLVNDLLDLAKVEAGRITVQPREFEAATLFGTLRGIMRPMLSQKTVELVFDEPVGLPALNTDEGKVSQVLRNLISNALKFTESGEVRVSARMDSPDRVLFIVCDTGIGIASEDQERIFQEWVQIDSPLQRRVKGTGLGLPLSRKLAELLGGDLELQSAAGQGSCFYLNIPAVYGASTSQPAIERKPPLPSDERPVVLVIEDHLPTLEIYRSCLRDRYVMVEARNLAEARAALDRVRPSALILDILLEGENAWPFLNELKGNPSWRDIRVLVVTVVDNRSKALALGADDFALKPVERAWLLPRLDALIGRRIAQRILLVDDDEQARYLLRHALVETGVTVSEASNGSDGLRLAREWHPDAIILDLMMPTSGYEVLEQLKLDPRTAAIPVIIHTSKDLDLLDRRLLLEKAADIVAKTSPDGDTFIERLRSALARNGMTLPQYGEASHA